MSPLAMLGTEVVKQIYGELILFQHLKEEKHAKIERKRKHTLIL